MSSTMISLIRAASQNVEAVAAHEGHSPDWLAGFRACLAGLEQAAPAPVTGPYHGPNISEQFRLLRALIGTQDPRGLQNMRDIIDYLESIITPSKEDEE